VALTGVVFTGAPPDPAEILEAQVRAHGRPVPATLTGSTVTFAQPQPRVAPGQMVVLYRGDAVVGGGPARV
jgi:tRNA U34 2-thiouridine synthase MnmA/TrmU